jgi:hypothetical protein
MYWGNLTKTDTILHLKTHAQAQLGSIVSLNWRSISKKLKDSVSFIFGFSFDYKLVRYVPYCPNREVITGLKDINQSYGIRFDLFYFRQMLIRLHITDCLGPSWSCSSLIHNYLCNQCLSPLTLWVRTPLRRAELDTTLYDKVCQWLATSRWFSLVSATNKTDRHDITEILLKVALSTINLNQT